MSIGPAVGIRVTIAAPNGAQPVWAFAQTVPAGTSQVSIAISPSMPSSLVLPIVPGVSVPAGISALPEPAQRAVQVVRADGESVIGQLP